MAITRKANFFYSFISNFGGKILTAVISIVTVPIFIRNWGDVRYSIWSLVFSMLAYLSVSGLGIDQAAGVLMAKAVSVEEKEKILFRSFVLVIFFAFLGILIFIFTSLINPKWVNILGKVPTEYSKELFLITLILGISYLLNLPFSVVRSGFHGFQKLYMEYLFGIILPVLNLVLLLCASFLKTNLIVYAFLYSIISLLVNIFKLIYLFRHVIESKVSSCFNYALKSNKIDFLPLVKSGIKYFAMGLLAFILYNTDNLVISKILGVSNVASYAITFKLFSMASMLVVGAVVSSFLPLAGAEYGKGNWSFLNDKYINLITMLVLLGGLIWCGGSFLVKYIVHIWVGPELYTGYWVVFFMGGYSYFYATQVLSGGLLQSFHYIKGTLFAYSLEAIINISTSIILSRKYGLVGIAFGTFIGAFFSSVLLPIFLKKFTNGKINVNVNFIIKHLILVILPLLTLSIVIRGINLSIIYVIMVSLIIFAYYTCVSFLIMPKIVKDKIFIILRKNKK